MSIVKRKRKDGSVIWCVRRTVHGREVFRTFGPGPLNRAAAESFDASLVSRKHAKRAGLGGGGIPDELLREAIKEAMNPIQMRVRGSTWAIYEFRLNQLAEWYGSAPVASVSASLLSDLQTRLKADGLEPKTINEYATMLSRALAHAVERGVIEKNPLANFKRLPEPSPVSTWRALSDDEIEKLVGRVARDWFGDFIIGLLNTGCRTGELRFLSWGGVQPDRLLIEPSAEYLGKTASARRTLPMNETLARIFEKNRTAGASFPFPSRNLAARTKKSTTESRWYQLQASLGWIDANGKSRFRLHDLRHTYACRLARAGVNPVAAQRLLGHSDIKHTLIYYRLTDAEVLNAGRQLDPVG